MKKFKRLFCLLLAVCLLTGALPMWVNAAVSANTIVANAQSLVGKYPYVYGGESPSEGGFDCSGLVYYVYNKMSGVNITLSQAGRGKAALAGAGSKITGISNFLPGDIVQFNYPHVAIYIGDSTIIEAAKSGTKVRTRRITSSSGVEYAVRLPSVSQGGAVVGKTSKPSVSVNGQTVTVSWSYSGSASYIDVYLIQQPWGPEDIKYHQSTTGNSVTFYNVADNGTGYAAYTVARPNPDSCSSEWADGIYVTLAHTTHTWDGGKVTKPATETSTGVKTYTCTVCGATKTETIAKLSHTTHKWDNGKVTKEATLTATGVKTYTCTVCGTTKTEVIAQLTSVTYTGQGSSMGPIYNGGKSIWTLTKDGTLRVSAPGNGEVADEPFSKEWKEYAYLVKSAIFEENVSSLRMAGIIMDLPNLSSVSFPSGLKQLGNIFTNATSLKTFTVPANAEIAYTISQGCYGLTHISVDPANKYYVSKDGVVFSKSMEELVVCPAGKSGDYIIPDGTVKLGKSAFRWSKYLTSITIPESVTDIDYTTFFSSLGDVNFRGELIIYKDSYAETYAKKYNIPYKIISNEEEPDETDFTDVPANAYYAQPVAWAVENNITGGTDKTHFSPSASCTRAQAVTFLWNAANRPEPQGSGNQFIDVKPGSYYEKAVQWAVENNITGGTDSTHFSPGETCTRAQIVTFLYHAASSPAVSGSGSFNDVKSGSYYENAVKWAVENGITSGTGNGKFSPYDNCVRGQIVTFLYRHAQG